MKLGLQLFTLYNIVKQPGGMAEALKMASAAGYDGVEFAGFGGLSIDEVAEELRKNNLEAAGYHLGWDNLTVDELESDLPRAIEIANKLGMRGYVVASYPGRDREDWINFARRIDRLGEKLRAQGILLGYHNHRVEARKLGDDYIIDLLLENCSPENVFWELDMRHVQIAGPSPVELAAKYAGRLTFLHMHDMLRITGAETADDCAVGAGIVDVPGVVKAAGDCEWLIVEENGCPEIGEHIKSSADYIRKNFIG